MGLPRPHVLRSRPTARETVDCAALERNELFLDELRHFLACLAGEASPVVDARAGGSLRSRSRRGSLETGESLGP